MDSPEASVLSLQWLHLREARLASSSAPSHVESLLETKSEVKLRDLRDAIRTWQSPPPTAQAEKALVSAMRTAGDERDKTAVKVLLEVLSDSLEVRSYSTNLLGEVAAGALERIGDPAAIERLISAIDTLHSGRRKWADPLRKGTDDDPLDPLLPAVASALSRIGGPESVPALAKTLVILKTHSARAVIAHELGRIGDPAASEALIVCLQDPTLKEAASTALVRIGEGAVSPLIVSVKGSSGDHRRTVERILVDIGEVAVAHLISAISNADPDIRWFAGDVLHERKWKPPDELQYAAFLVARRKYEPAGQKGALAVGPLFLALNTSPARDRGQILLALALTGDPSALAPVTAALSDPEMSVREAAAEGLGHIRDKSSVAPLVVALRDSQARVRCSTAAALGEIGERAAIAPLNAALRDAERTVRAAAAVALAKLDPSQGATTAVMALLRESRTPSNQDTAVKALESIGTPSQIEEMIPGSAWLWWRFLLQCGLKAQRTGIVDQLAVVGGPRAAKLLMGTLNGGRIAVSYRAVKALQPLSKQLSSEDADRLARFLDETSLGKLIDHVAWGNRWTQAMICQAHVSFASTRWGAMIRQKRGRHTSGHGFKNYVVVHKLAVPRRFFGIWASRTRYAIVQHMDQFD